MLFRNTVRYNILILVHCRPNVVRAHFHRQTRDRFTAGVPPISTCHLSAPLSLVGVPRFRGACVVVWCLIAYCPVSSPISWFSPEWAHRKRRLLVRSPDNKPTRTWRVASRESEHHALTFWFWNTSLEYYQHVILVRSRGYWWLMSNFFLQPFCLMCNTACKNLIAGNLFPDKGYV